MEPLTVLAGFCTLCFVPEVLRWHFFRDFQRGTSAMQAKNWDDAVEQFSSFLVRLPNRPGLRRISRLCMFPHDIEAMALVNLGVCELRRERATVAQAHFQRAVDLDPKFAVACFNLGIAYLASQQTVEAIRWFREAELRGFGGRALRRHLTPLGSEFAQEVNATHGLQLGPSAALGHLYVSLGVRQEAIRCFRRGVSAKERGAVAGLAGALLQEGLMDEAAGHLAWLERHESHEPGTHLLHIAYWSLRGDFDRALDHCQQAGALSPDRAWALANTAETLFVAGRWEEAEKVANEALAANPDFYYTYGVLAQLAVRIKDWNTALAHADLAMGHQPSSHALEARAFALRGLGRNAEAQKAFQLFLDHVRLTAPLECDLEYRTTLARQILDELQPLDDN